MTALKLKSYKCLYYFISCVYNNR